MAIGDPPMPYPNHVQLDCESPDPELDPRTITDRVQALLEVEARRDAMIESLMRDLRVRERVLA